MTNSQESEGSLSYSASYIYQFDFVATDFVDGVPTFAAPRSKILGFISFLKNLFVSTALISFEYIKFSFVFYFYILGKLVSFVYFLEGIKDTLVKVLMWRRGLLFRPVVHGGLFLIAAVALVVGGLFRGSVAATDFTRNEVLEATNTTETIVPEGRPRSEIAWYKVKSGDSLSKLAKEYSVSVQTIKWANKMSTDKIRSGMSLKIPPTSGVLHKVKKGDYLGNIARKYRVDAQTIADYPFNYIDDTLKISRGQVLMIPGGIIRSPKQPTYTSPAAPTYFGGSGLFAWPVRGSISQYASWWHPALDIAAPWGSPVYSATGGKVVATYYHWYGYGHHIVIDHGNGYTSLYAHLSTINVRPGQFVCRGCFIGRVGTTGRSTGSHLHFEARRNGTALNPLSVL